MQAKYTVLERLGGGGQAEVFRGISESLQGYKKAVAIKRVLPHLNTNERFVAMFLD
jgi:serine/threonine-protein kinase